MRKRRPYELLLEDILVELNKGKKITHLTMLTNQYYYKEGETIKNEWEEEVPIEEILTYEQTLPMEETTIRENNAYGWRVYNVPKIRDDFWNEKPNGLNPITMMDTETDFMDDIKPRKQDDSTGASKEGHIEIPSDPTEAEEDAVNITSENILVCQEP